MMLRRLPSGLSLLVLLSACLLGGGCASSRVYEESIQPSRMRIFPRARYDNPTAQLAHAQEQFVEGNNRRATRAFRALLNRWPRSEEVPHALYGAAISLEERGKGFDAFDYYQRLIDERAGWFDYDRVIEAQFRIALDLFEGRSERRRFLSGYRSLEDVVPLLEKVARNAPQSPAAAKAQFHAGEARQLMNEFVLAAAAFERVQFLYPGTVYAERAAFREAESKYQAARSIQPDELQFDAARAAFQTFLEAYPQSELRPLAEGYIATIREEQARIAFDRARFYERVARDRRAALLSYQSVVQRYPETGAANEARRRVEALSRPG